MALHTDERQFAAQQPPGLGQLECQQACGQYKPVCTVNYYMNLLQSLPCQTPVIVSL